MTDKERVLFEKLSEDRKESAVILEKTSMRGLKTSVVEKYSDQAHFIYELIQNADDVGASEARFVLFPDKLIFVHNGTRCFTVTDTETEEEDTLSGNLGDLNAITSIANSNKTSASIGKFGVGFKAVFQYTTTPYIYDPNISFKIERFIVPVLLDEECTFKREHETAFVFPFDHPGRKAPEAYTDIFHKLQNLVFPTLFLFNLKKITYKCGDINGEYVKVVRDTIEFDDTVAEKLEFINGSNQIRNRMWLFSRVTDEGYKYSCGFFVDKDQKLVPTNYYAFCFFPTKKDTNLNFIINAPFLLTDSREGIKASDGHNVRMISLLAKLAADSFSYLRDIGIKENVRIIDEDILKYLPVVETKYIPKNIGDDISFKPFYDEILNKFKTDRLLPGINSYVYAPNAQRAEWPDIPVIFDNEKLKLLENDRDVEWIFPGIGFGSLSRSAKDQHEYLAKIVTRKSLDNLDMIQMITGSFTAKQTNEWLFKLYEFCIGTEQKITKSKTAPIFKTNSGKVSAAFDSAGHALLFSDSGDGEYETISDELMKDSSTQALVSRLNIKAPELKDRVYSKVLKKGNINPVSDFSILLRYYIELVNDDKETSSYIRQLNDREFILGVTGDGCKKKVCRPERLYFPNDSLLKYFDGDINTLFVDYGEYSNKLSRGERNYLDDFLKELGVCTHVRVNKVEYTKEFVNKEFNVKWELSKRNCSWVDYRLDNDENVLNRICDNEDKELSIILWKQLVSIFENESVSFWRPTIGGVYNYFYYREQRRRFEGISERILKTKKWLYDRNGNFKNVNEISPYELDGAYDLDQAGVKPLLKFLGIKDNRPEYSNLDEDVRKKLEAYDTFAELGLFDLPKERIIQLMDMLNPVVSKEDTRPAGEEDNLTGENENDVYIDDSDSHDPSPEERVLKDITQRVHQRNEKGSKEEFALEPEKSNESEADNDEITKAPVDYSKKMEQAKQKFEDELAKLVQAEEAQQRAQNSEKYSYGWFKALLELEAMATGEESSNSREVAISFSAVEKESGSIRTLILKHPDKNIPQVMEELVDIPLVLTLKDGQTKTLIIEVANVKSYTLRVKVKQNDYLVTADFSQVNQARIVTQNPTFLTKELFNAFTALSEKPFCITNDYNLQKNLCSNIEFIFGPPGTGKTTYLARNTIIPLVANNEKVRILVLAPTNKAADVLTTRIMDSSKADNNWEDWLIRYGVTIDDRIEMSPAFHGKEFEIDDYDKCVVVTTMARLPYDYFIDSKRNHNYLYGINWDYIIVDEASMIPLIYMVYLLYRKTPRKFIIAGDPFQIEPTTVVKEWKNENIYKMVKLDQFSEQVETIPQKYDVKLLTTQYRSIDRIGEIFSRLTYRGILKHARGNSGIKKLNIEEYLDYSNLNIIKFPVSQYESIYRAKRLKLSSYHVYSALFVYEFATFLAQALAKANGKDENFSIGIIAPYGAQAGLIGKLIAAANIPRNIDVNTGTIHGFQGDECDIVIALFNPPPSISTNKEMFLNRQNIINVAISRARDYLFVLMPDNDTTNVQNLNLIKRMESIIKEDEYVECNTKDLEQELFNDRNYLEENAFSTGHQLVNVYGLPEKRYEIRSEENAIDVQVYGKSNYQPLSVDKKNVAEHVQEQRIEDAVVGKTVSHKRLGYGKIVNCDGKYLEASFDGTIHKFPFPGCFAGALVVDDRIIQKELEELLS